MLAQAIPGPGDSIAIGAERTPAKHYLFKYPFPQVGALELRFAFGVIV